MLSLGRNESLKIFSWYQWPGSTPAIFIRNNGLENAFLIEVESRKSQNFISFFPGIKRKVVYYWNHGFELGARRKAACSLSPIDSISPTVEHNVAANLNLNKNISSLKLSSSKGFYALQNARNWLKLFRESHKGSILSKRRKMVRDVFQSTNQ